MANTRRDAPQNHARAGLEDRAVRSRVIYEYEVPDEDGLWQETTQSFGSIRRVGLRLLTPLEEKNAARAASGDTTQLGFELGKRSVAEITNSNDETFTISGKDAVDEQFWGQVHSKIRMMIMQAYAENAVPKESTTASFLGSRTIKA